MDFTVKKEGNDISLSGRWDGVKAHGHLEYLEECGGSATGEPIGATRDNLKSVIAGGTYGYTDMYPRMAKSAWEEDFEEIADWKSIGCSGTLVPDTVSVFRIHISSSGVD